MRAECPICVVPLAEAVTATCPRCRLTWRAPSRQSIRLEPESPRSRSRSATTRPDTGLILLHVLGFPVIIVPIGVAILAAVFDGGTKDLLGRALGALFAAAVLFYVLSNAWATLVQVLAPPRVDEDGDVLRVRLGGLGKHGRSPIPVAKADLRDVLLEPQKNGRFTLWIVHKSGPALLVAEELRAPEAERLGARIRGWFGETEAGYRGRAAMRS